MSTSGFCKFEQNPAYPRFSSCTQCHNCFVSSSNIENGVSVFLRKSKKKYELSIIYTCDKVSEKSAFYINVSTDKL